MININKMIGLLSFFFTLTSTNLFCPNNASATGISIDAGLTPAANRWMFRTQIRFMERDNDPTMKQREMKAYMFPVVVAYGVRSDLTVMVRQAYMRREMSMMGKNTTTNGFADLFVMGKFRLVRINTHNYTLGIAPTLGLEFPTGKDGLTSHSYDLRLGSYFSGRLHSWGMDLNVTYVWNGLAKSSNVDFNPGDEFSIEAAIAKQISLGSEANFALAPVLEASYLSALADRENGNKSANTGESIFLLSPGIKITWNSIIFESLIQFPLWQDQEGLQTERATGFLVGIRLMN